MPKSYTRNSGGFNRRPVAAYSRPNVTVITSVELFFASRLRCHVAMVRTHYLTRRAAEQQFPFRVDIPVPGDGLGERLNEMVTWCRKHIVSEWDHHGRTDRAGLDARGIAIDVARFYFMTDADAGTFRQRWRA